MPLGKTIAFLGAGNMAEALVKGLLRAQVAAPGEILCTDRRLERGPELTGKYGVRFGASNAAAAKRATTNPPGASSDAPSNAAASTDGATTSPRPAPNSISAVTTSKVFIVAFSEPSRSLACSLPLTSPASDHRRAAAIAANPLPHVVIATSRSARNGRTTSTRTERMTQRWSGAPQPVSSTSSVAASCR